MVTLVGEIETKPLPVVRLITCPPVGARSLNVTVRVVVDSVDTVKGLGVKLTDRVAAGLTVKAALAVPLAVTSETMRAPVGALLAITKLAVCEVDVPPPTTAAVTPAPLTVRLVIPSRFVPVISTDTVCPCSPAAGANDEMVGVGGSTVNGSEKGVPPTTRPMVAAPVAAVALITTVAVTVVPVGVPVIVPVTPALLDTTAVAPERFVPVKVMGNEVPTEPLLGDTLVNVGVADATVKGSENGVPPTITPRVVAPVAAVALITTVAVTVVPVGVPVIVPVTPRLGEVIAVAFERFVPVKVTVAMVVPTVPLLGEMLVSVGVAAFTVNGSEKVWPPIMSPNVVAPVAAVAKIVIEAVTEVADLLLIVPVIPGLPETTAVAFDRFVPVKVKVVVVPMVPLPAEPPGEVMEVRVGVAATTVNGSDRGVPFTTTPKVVAPVVAVEAITTVALTVVLDVPVIVALTPGLPETMALALERFVPVKVTGNDVPTVPVLGDTLVSVGVAGLIVNGNETVWPPTVTPRLDAPVAAVALITTVALTEVLDVPVIVALTLVLLDTAAVAPERLVPLKVTGNVVPTVPLLGVTLVSVGVVEAVVKVTM
jgi:hypothetical protein